MKATLVNKNELGLDEILARMTPRMTLANYAESATPACGPKQVIEYLGRYTHKVAISNHPLSWFSPSDASQTSGYTAPVCIWIIKSEVE